NRTCEKNFRHFGPSRIILISRQRNRCQNSNDRHNDHQFNKGETLLHLSFHFSTPFVCKIADGLTGSLLELCQTSIVRLLSVSNAYGWPRCVAFRDDKMGISSGTEAAQAGAVRQDVTFLVRPFVDR